MADKITYYVYPIFLALILLEAVLSQSNCKYTCLWKDILASFGIAIGHRASQLVFGFIPLSIYSFLWQHRLLTIPLNQWWGILLLFWGVEFCYYWLHRAAHEIRWMWATHAVHHSATYFNLSTAVRLGWTGWLSGNFLFFAPLLWLGFEPTAIVITLALNLIYQFWIHTELIPKLGILEWVLNTPSHHRVHHGSNPTYLDRNYGGVVIIFDRLFDTFTAEKPALRPIYGLTHPLCSYNPLIIAFHEWSRLFQDLIKAKTWRARCSVIWGRST